MAAAVVWGLCLAWAANVADLPDTQGTATADEVALPARNLTLAWTHSIERVRWEERYTVLAPGDSGARCAPLPNGALCPLQARVVGSGAGMEPAPHARWRAGGYEWAPAPTPLPALRLMHSAHAADYRLCVDATCRPLAAWRSHAGPNTGSSGDEMVRLRPCPLPSYAPTPASAARPGD